MVQNQVFIVQLINQFVELSIHCYYICTQMHIIIMNVAYTNLQQKHTQYCIPQALMENQT